VRRRRPESGFVLKTFVIRICSRPDMDSFQDKDCSGIVGGKVPKRRLDFEKAIPPGTKALNSKVFTKSLHPLYVYRLAMQSNVARS